MRQRILDAFSKCCFELPPKSKDIPLDELCELYHRQWQRSTGVRTLRVFSHPRQNERASGSRTSVPHTASVIFAHGLGDNGEGWACAFRAVAERMPHVHFLFPTARRMPVTLNGGMEMPAWYDIPALDANRLKMHAHGILESTALIHALVVLEQRAIQANINEAIAPAGTVLSSASDRASISSTRRVVVGGFSQGGALGMFAGHVCEELLGGVVALSGYCTELARMSSMRQRLNCEMPLLMCHGTSDAVVPFSLAKESFDWAIGPELRNDSKERLRRGASRFLTFPGMGHESCNEEMSAVATFVESALPPFSLAPLGREGELGSHEKAKL